MVRAPGKLETKVYASIRNWFRFVSPVQSADLLSSDGIKNLTPTKHTKRNICHLKLRFALCFCLVCRDQSETNRKRDDDDDCTWLHASSLARSALKSRKHSASSCESTSSGSSGLWNLDRTHQRFLLINRWVGTLDNGSAGWSHQSLNTWIWFNRLEAQT